MGIESWIGVTPEGVKVWAAAGEATPIRVRESTFNGEQSA